MTNAITRARRALRSVRRPTRVLFRAVWTRAVQGLSAVARSHAAWSARTWTAFHEGNRF